MQDFEVVFYQKENGEEPIKEFLLSLNIKMRAKVMRSISILEKTDWNYENHFQSI